MATPPWTRPPVMILDSSSPSSRLDLDLSDTLRPTRQPAMSEGRNQGAKHLPLLSVCFPRGCLCFIMSHSFTRGERRGSEGITMFL